MSKKEHLTIEGLRKVVSVRAVMNRGLTDVLKEHFTDLILVKRPLVELIRVENSDWVVGFVDAVLRVGPLDPHPQNQGEGSFGVLIGKAPNVKTGYKVELRFTITQHVRDHKLLESFAKYFDCGWVFIDSNKPIVHFIVSKYSDIICPASLQGRLYLSS